MHGGLYFRHPPAPEPITNEEPADCSHSCEGSRRQNAGPGAAHFIGSRAPGRGGLYLLYLGIKLLRAGVSSAKLTAPAAPKSRWRLFANMYLVSALNPKGIVFYVAFLPQFINPKGDVNQQLWILAATFVALAVVNASLYAVFAVSARNLLASPRAQRRFHMAGGSLLSAAGVWALLAKRHA